MINVQVKATKIKHSEFGIRFSRDKSLRYKAVSLKQCSPGLQPCKLDNWTLSIDYLIFNSGLSALGGFIQEERCY